MKNHQFFILSLALVVVGISLADISEWPTGARPPIELAEALASAQSKMSDRTEFYCAKALLLTDRERPPSRCAWNLKYSAIDGRERLFVVNESGQCTLVREHDPQKQMIEPIESLRDAADSILKTLSEAGLKSSLVVDGGVFRISQRARQFQVYSLGQDGRYSTELSAQIGPESHGCMIELEEVPAASKVTPDPWGAPTGNQTCSFSRHLTPNAKYVSPQNGDISFPWIFRTDCCDLWGRRSGHLDKNQSASCLSLYRAWGGCAA